MIKPCSLAIANLPFILQKGSSLLIDFRQNVHVRNFYASAFYTNYHTSQTPCFIVRNDSPSTSDYVALKFHFDGKAPSSLSAVVRLARPLKNDLGFSSNSVYQHFPRQSLSRYPAYQCRQPVHRVDFAIPLIETEGKFVDVET